MPIEEDINEVSKNFESNKMLPEFKAMAKFLEGRLKKGEEILLGVDGIEPIVPIQETTEIVSLDLYYIGKEPEMVASLVYLGDLTFRKDIFEDYLKSQRE